MMESDEIPRLPRAAAALRRAGALIEGDRQNAYGHPSVDLACTGELWSAWLRRRGLLREDADLEPFDVAEMMALLKTSRLAGGHRGDSFDDQLGYAALGAEVAR
jgi:hypothetical protein